MLTLHDSHWEPKRGVGHHPHRFNERLFYILERRVHHDDVLNRIAGDMEAGDLVRLTEGQRGMIHEEWNHESAEAHAFIVVYHPQPSPPAAEFAALRSADVPILDEAPSVRSRILVGEQSPMRVNGDIRLFFCSPSVSGSKQLIELAEWPLRRCTPGSNAG